MFISSLCSLTGIITIISFILISQNAYVAPVQSYIAEIIIGSAAGILFFPIAKLFTYHLQLLYKK